MNTLRLRRSELSTPATSAKMMRKAAESEADLVFLDLEDAVAPALKEEARGLAVGALNELDWSGKVRGVRVNAADTRWAHGDVIEVLEGAGAAIDVLILPKVRSPRDVWFFETLVEQLEQRLGLANRIGFEALIEESEGLARVEEIALCSPRLEALILGFGDLAASQGIRVGHVSDPQLRYPGDLWSYHRNRMIGACRAAGIDAIDGPWANFRDPEGYRREATWATTLGAVGKWAIHPSQIAIANEVFSPSAKEIERALRDKRAYDEAVAAGAGAAGNEAGMIDAVHARVCEGVLERARLCGLEVDA